MNQTLNISFDYCAKSSTLTCLLFLYSNFKLNQRDLY